MEYVALTAATVAFTLCLHLFRVSGFARRIFAASGEAVTTMRAPALDDDEKEKGVQRAALEVLRAFGALLAGVGASLLLSAAVIFFGAAAGAYSMDALMLAAANGYFIAGSAIFVIAAMAWMR